MAKYLIRGTYTAEGICGVLKDGGTARVQAVKQLVEGLGGTIEGFYFAFGEDDFVIIVDGTDIPGILAGTMASGVTGAVRTTTTVLISPDDLDAASKMLTTYRPPGQ